MLRNEILPNDFCQIKFSEMQFWEIIFGHPIAPLSTPASNFAELYFAETTSPNFNSQNLLIYWNFSNILKQYWFEVWVSHKIEKTPLNKRCNVYTAFCEMKFSAKWLFCVRNLNLCEIKILWNAIFWEMSCCLETINSQMPIRVKSSILILVLPNYI